MKYGPGNWSAQLAERTAARATGMRNSLEAYGQETAARVLDEAQEWVSRFTVVIGTPGLAKSATRVHDIAPGSGVIVRLDNDTYGVLTAGHVLKRGANTRDSVSLALLAPQRGGARDVMAIDIPPRPSIASGFDNESESGPDIAFVPISISEWSTLEGWGRVAYNLNRKRWSNVDTAQLGEMSPWVVSVIHGLRFAASEIIESHTDGTAGSLTMMTTNTRVGSPEERGGYDYLELPSKVTERSYPTHWKNELPGTAAEEIEELHAKRVTGKAWGGTSGAGVWNVAIGTCENGLPNGTVLAELAGICFFAQPSKECIIAHGPKSIERITRPAIV